MANGFEDSTYTVCEDKGIGNVQIADEVIAVIAALAATEVDGVECIAGNITNELVSKVGLKSLSKGCKVEILPESVKVFVSIVLKYGYSIPAVSAKVQDRISTAIENMTGLKTEEVNIKVDSVKMER